MEYDSFLTYIRDFGPSQKRVVIMAVLIEISVAIQILLGVFTMAVPDFRCAIPGLDNDTYNIQSDLHEQMLNQSLPFNTNRGHYSDCFVWAAPIEVSNGTNTTDESNRTTEKCSKWVYSQEVFESTLVSDLDLVCDRLIFTTHTNVMTMAGFMCSSLIGGVLADIFGRKRVILLASGVVFAAATGLAFVEQVSALLVLKFIVSSAAICVFLSVFVLCTEIVGPKKRSQAGMLIMIGWVIGMFLLGVVAYPVRNWRYLQLILSCPTAIFVLSWWLIPESPRWLLNKGKIREANKILMHMAKLNRVELPQSVTPSNAESKDTNKDSSTSVGVRETILLLRKAPSLQLRILILVFDWFVCSLTYYGLTLNVGSILEGDLHLNYFILCVMEFLAYLTALLLLDRIGRKILFCSSTIVGGVACLACVVPVVTNSEAAWINIVLSNIGKFGISCSFAVIWLYTTELIPTTFRNTGIGVCSFGGRIGGIISPYIGNLYLFMGGNFGKALPMVVFGVIAVLSGVLSLFLPETHNRKLPETITEAEKIRR